jgi:hypothetical protein
MAALKVALKVDESALIKADKKVGVMVERWAF